jgi:hypothetical protein
MQPDPKNAEATKGKTPAPHAEHPEGEGGGGLRQIQRIIVDPRVRELQASLDTLDQRRLRDLTDLRKELDRTINRSDDFIKKESSVLGERLAAEKHERGKMVDERARELQARIQSLEERLEKVDERLGSGLRELRQLVLDQYREYAQELRSWREDLARTIAHELSDVRSEKADRSLLAQLLVDVGERLGTQGGESLTH